MEQWNLIYIYYEIFLFQVHFLSSNLSFTFAIISNYLKNVDILYNDGLGWMEKNNTCVNYSGYVALTCKCVLSYQVLIEFFQHQK